MSSADGLLHQTFTLNTTQGPLTYGFDDLEYLRVYYIQESIIFGVKIGTAISIFVVSFLFTMNWNQPVFIFNQISLFFLVMETVFYIAYALGPIYSLEAALTFSTRKVTDADYNISMASSIFQLLLIISIECSLFFQCWTMYRDNFRFIGKCVPWVMLVVAVIPNVVFWSIFVISSCIAAKDPYGDKFLTDNPWVWAVPRAFFSSSVTLFSLLSVVKLFITLKRRRNMGLKQFGPFQIVFIMAAQTMVLPGVLTLLAFFVEDSPETLVTLAPFIVTIFLPLSSIWAKFKSTQTSAPINFNFSNLTPRSTSDATYVSPVSPTSKTKLTSTPSRDNFDTTKDPDIDYHHIMMSVDRQSQHTRDVEKSPF
jgi:pheromone alpha factor receptor